MATIFTDGFEVGFGGWVQSGTTARMSNDTSVVHAGQRSFLVDNTASAAQAWLAKDIADANIHVAQLYIRIATAPSGTTGLYELVNAQGHIYIVVTSGRIARIQMNTTAFSGPTLNLNQWYRWDIRANTSGATATVDWQIDGVAQTQATRVQPAALITAVNLGFVSTFTGKVYFDDIIADDSSASYPLGAPAFRIAYPEVSAGTGAANQNAPNVKPSAQRPTGTGQTWSGITGDLVVAGQNSPGQAFAISNDIETRVVPDATPASGTGTASNAGKTSKPSIAQAAGAGAATSAVIKSNPVSEIASGLGAATDATITKTLSAAPSASSGTGTAVNPTIMAVATLTEPGLTLQMGM